MNNNSTRASSLDALRGYAILTMVLSGSVAWGVLPGWMYHAQVGPRSNFVFDGSIYGITWVDLVFPFFLFAMGAAFPFSIGNKYRKGSSRRRIIYDSLLRGFRLTFFAIFIQQHEHSRCISQYFNQHPYVFRHFERNPHEHGKHQGKTSQCNEP